MGRGPGATTRSKSLDELVPVARRFTPGDSKTRSAYLSHHMSGPTTCIPCADVNLPRARILARRNKGGTITEGREDQPIAVAQIVSRNLEAPPGFEPGVEVLQTVHVALSC